MEFMQSQSDKSFDLAIVNRHTVLMRVVIKEQELKRVKV